LYKPKIISKNGGVSLLILRKSDIEKAISMDEAISAMETAFIKFSEGNTKIPLRTVINVEDKGDAIFMPGYVEGLGVAVKLVSVFPGNLEIGKPTINSVILLEDQNTGEVLALMDGGCITALRTGAASGLATKYLARTDSKSVAVIGAGVQAKTQLWAVCSVRDIQEARIFDLNDDRKKRYIEEMSEKFPYIRFAGVSNTDEAVKGADIIITATTSKKPVFSAENVSKGAHINAMGAYTPEMQELPEKVLKMADKIVVDSREAVLKEAGDLIIPIRKGIFSEKQIYGELGEVASGIIPGRQTDKEITLFKTVGIAAEDVACAAKIYENALLMGLGEEIFLDN